MNNQTFDEYTETYHCCRWCRHYIDSMKSCTFIEDNVSFVNDEMDIDTYYDTGVGYFMIHSPDTFYCKYFE